MSCRAEHEVVDIVSLSILSWKAVQMGWRTVPAAYEGVIASRLVVIARICAVH